MVLCIINLIPPKRNPPFLRDYNALTNDLCVAELDRWAMLVNAYLISIEKNATIITTRVKIMVSSGILLGLMIIVIIMMAMIPKTI